MERVAIASGRFRKCCFLCELHPAGYLAADGTRLACIGPGHRVVLRDTETGETVRELALAGHPQAVCAYRVGGRTFIAVAGYRQVHRFDAETGEQAGPPLFGHRRTVRGVTAGVIDGRPVIFSADGATVRRWDAETGTPWPAVPPASGDACYALASGCDRS